MRSVLQDLHVGGPKGNADGIAFLVLVEALGRVLDPHDEVAVFGKAVQFEMIMGIGAEIDGVGHPAGDRCAVSLSRDQPKSRAPGRTTMRDIAGARALTPPFGNDAPTITSAPAAQHDLAAVVAIDLE